MKTHLKVLWQVFLCMTIALQLGLPSSSLFAQEKQRREQETESIWIVSQAYIPGGQKFSSDYTDEEHARRVYESLKSARGLDDKPVYFDVTIEPGQRPVSRPSSGYDPKPRDDGQVKSKSAISLPDLKVVSPGGSGHGKRKATPSNKAKLISGKKFAAVVGSANVTLDFAPDGKVTIASPIQGKSLVAGWYFDESDRLVVDAFNADFVADLFAERFVGIRTTKDRSDKRPWSFSLRDIVDADNSRGMAYNAPRVDNPSVKTLEGRWGKDKMEINEKGEITKLALYGQFSTNVKNATYRFDGKTISIVAKNVQYSGDWSYRFEGKWDGEDEIVGTLTPLSPRGAPYNDTPFEMRLNRN